MCECGCTSGNTVFKLKAPDGWYLIELQRGCGDCYSGPGIQVYHPEAQEYIDDIDEISELPVIGKGESCISLIKCGLDPEEGIAAVVKCMAGTDVEDGKVDEALAEIWGKDLWEDAFTGAPSVIDPKEKGDKK